MTDQQNNYIKKKKFKNIFPTNSISLNKYLQGFKKKKKSTRNYKNSIRQRFKIKYQRIICQ